MVIITFDYFIPEQDAMNLERYLFINSNDFRDYEFYSDGPRGWIKKIIMFTKTPNSKPPVLVYFITMDTDNLSQTFRRQN